MRGSILRIWLSYKKRYFNSRLYMRGSTQKMVRSLTLENFNSRLYMRGSVALKLQNIPVSIFQFTPLHERQQNEHVKESIDYFISIHASTWEAAISVDRDSTGRRISIHASTWEAAYIPMYPYLALLISIHASTWEAARVYTCLENTWTFQFTPLHERQLQKYTIFSIKSTQFSTKPCFFIVTSRKVVFFSIPVQYFL